MSLQSLTILEGGRHCIWASVRESALPAHTSDTTQPLDVGVFQPRKARIKQTLCEVSSVNASNIMDVCDQFNVLINAYEQSFNVNNIQKVFLKTGQSPLDSIKLLDIPHPLSEDNPYTYISPEVMEAMFEKKRAARRDGLVIAPVVLKRGFISTSGGLNLTNAEAMDLFHATE